MAIDDMKDDSAYSSLFVSLKSIFGEDTSSSNDLAWADSCLNTNVNASTDWSSIKDVISTILNSDSGSVDSIAAKNITKQSINGDLNFRDYVASLGFSRGSDDDEDLIDDVIGDIESIDISDNNEDNLTITNSKRVRERGKKRIKNVFRPNYNEDIAKDQSNDTGTYLNSSAWELESSSDDIFKVWDLGISEEQDDFTIQMEKVFDDFPVIQLNPDNSPAWEDMMHVFVDNLIAGMDDLSLEKNL